MILMNDFKAEPQELRDAMLAATKRVLILGGMCLAMKSSLLKSNGLMPVV